MGDISERDRRLIDELRGACQHLLTPNYDTDYNILRFIKGWGYKKDTALHYLQRHLKYRKALRLDRLHELEDNEIVKEHYPHGLVGPAGNGNKILVIECAGRIDIQGMMKSVQAIDFYRYEMKFLERVYAVMNEQERISRKQSGAMFIFDLDGIRMDPGLLPILTGSYGVLCRMIGENYPEWIHTAFVVNVPTFFGILYKAISPFIPTSTKKKMKVLTGDWKKQLIEHIHPDYLPVHWGGNMTDENGDHMCRSRIIVPRGKIPRNLYWKNIDKYRPLPDDQVNIAKIKSGSFNLWTYFVPETGTVLNYYTHSERNYTFTIYYTDDVKEMDVRKMDEIFPRIEIPGGLAPDKFHFICEQPGAYHVKLGNEKSWLFSITVKYAWRFTNPDGSTADDVLRLNGNEV